MAVTFAWGDGLFLFLSIKRAPLLKNAAAFFDPISAFIFSARAHCPILSFTRKSHFFTHKKAPVPTERASCRILFLFPYTCEMTLDCFSVLIQPFFTSLNPSAIKGHFCTFLVSNIFLTSLSFESLNESSFPHPALLRRV